MPTPTPDMTQTHIANMVGMTTAGPTPTRRPEVSHTQMLPEEEDSSQQSQRPFPYLGWFLAALLGTIGFLISEVVSWYHKLDPSDTREEVSFRKYTLWYVGNLVRGPIIVVLILVVLANISLNLGTEGTDGTAALGINFGELPPIVLLALALMLGIYSRTARIQLDLIMKRLLPQAWKESHLKEGQAAIEGQTAIALATTADYVLSTQDVATWKVTYSQHIQSISLWADDQSPQTPAVADLPTIPFSGKYLYIKVESLEPNQPSGKVRLQATVEGKLATLDITVS